MFVFMRTEGNEGMTASMVGIHKFLRFELYGWIERKAGSGSTSKITT